MCILGSVLLFAAEIVEIDVAEVGKKKQRNLLFAAELLLVPNHFEWFGDYSVWSCPCVRPSVRPFVYKNCSIIS